MGHMQQRTRERRLAAAARGGLDQARRGERAEDALDQGRGLLPSPQDVRLRQAAACRELRVAVADVRLAGNHVPQIVTVRAGQVQHEVGRGVGLLVRAPPDLDVVERSQARPDVEREFP